MATNSPAPPPDFVDSDLMNYVVRMVIPMRREFSRSLDVSHFLHDFSYAKEIIEQAKASNDARLREYAAHLDSKMFGPRNADKPAVTKEKSAPPASAPSSAANAKPESSASQEPTEAEMRAKMMAKYKSGLR